MGVTSCTYTGSLGQLKDVAELLKKAHSPQVQGALMPQLTKEAGQFVSEENNLRHTLIQILTKHGIGGGQQHLAPGTWLMECHSRTQVYFFFLLLLSYYCTLWA